MSKPNSIKKQLPKIRKYVIEILEKNADRSIYTTIGRLYRVEQHIRTILLEENLSTEEKDMVFLTLYAATIELSNNKIKVFDLEKILKFGQ